MRLIPQPESVEIFSGTTELCDITKRVIVKEFTCEEEYELEISPDEIIVRAATEKGLFYGEITFKQIRGLYDSLPCLVIRDKPRFAHRGFMIDCARHMFTVSQLKRMIDVASQVKFNKFHWHLSDDQGFRTEPPPKSCVVPVRSSSARPQPASKCAVNGSLSALMAMRMRSSPVFLSNMHCLFVRSTLRKSP